MPASQLSQLKAALTGAGLNRKSTSKKDKKAFKKGGARETDRQKKFDKLDDIRKGLNKFDERETKIKHDVGGRSIKGVIGRPSASKQAGLDQRRKNLLPEHQLRNHTGTFNDRRFGENNPGLTVDERMQERYTRERQRGQGKKGMFNLEDDEQDLFGFDEGTALGGLTHGGRSVMDLKGDDFMAQGLGEDEEDDDERGNIGRRVVDRAHFGGFGTNEEGEGEEREERKKSKQEVMAEVMAKSKEYKFARQQQAEVDAGIREALDADINDLQALLSESVRARSNIALPSSAGPSRTAPITQHPKGVDGEYDQLVRELAFDTRAKPKNRTKTEEELAIEEKDKLEAAEAKRIRRMRGEESDDEDEGARKKRKKEKRGDADDLEDDFVEEELLGPGLTRENIEAMATGKLGEEEEDVADTEEEDDDDDESGDEDEEGDENESDEDGEEDEDEDGDEEDESEASSMADLAEQPLAISEDEDGEPDGAIVKSKKTSGKSSKGKTKEIPYTFPCPATIEDFEDILEELEDDAYPTVVQRIRALHHPSLAQGNKEKLQTFLGVLIDLVLLLASRPIPAFSLITSLQPHLIALVKLNPITAAFHFTAKLTLMQKNLTRGLARGPDHPGARTWPGVAELVLLRIIGTVWSTSDFSHPVVAPAVLLMGQYLSQARIRRVSDVAAGLFLVSILAQYESDSKRIIPEALNFLAAAMTALLPRRRDAKPVNAYPELQALGTSLFIATSSSAAPSEPVDLAKCLQCDDTTSAGDIEQCKADLLAVTLRLVQTYATMYANQNAFIELLQPIKLVLESSRVPKSASALKDLHSKILLTLTRQLHFALQSRQPLSLQAHKPLPIRTHTPKFESDFAPGKHYDPDVDRNATAKLKNQYKKERKGAIRELRKDNRFLAGVKAGEARAKDEGYKERMRRVEGSIQVERAEEKEMEREKKRDKRRAGK